MVINPRRHSILNGFCLSSKSAPRRIRFLRVAFSVHVFCKKGLKMNEMHARKKIFFWLSGASFKQIQKKKWKKMSVAWLSCHLLQNFDQTSLQVLANRRGNFCTMAFTRIAEQPGQSLTRLQAPVVRRVDSAIHWITLLVFLVFIRWIALFTF